MNNVSYISNYISVMAWTFWLYYGLFGSNIDIIRIGLSFASATLIIIGIIMIYKNRRVKQNG